MKFYLMKPATVVSWCAAGAMLLLGANDSWATTCAMVAPPFTLIVNVPAVLTVPKNTPNGTLLFTSAEAQVTGQAYYRCNSGSPWGYVSAVGPTYASGPSPIGNTGLGWRWTYSGYPGLAYPGGIPVMSAGQNFTGTFSGLQIFKIGNVSSGSLPAGTIGTMRAGTNNVDLLVMKLSNSITVIEASCQTPTVHVNLGKHRISEFGAVGSTVGQTPFNIRLDNCPSGLSGISYQLDPITPAFNASQGILTISGGGASGVGIQITDENNASVRLGERLRFLDTPPSGNLTIPLRAAYYKTAQQVSSGPANAAMQFTITYQ